MISPLGETATQPSEKLNLKTRFAYGVGEIAGALPNSVSAFFFLYFLTNVAGLEPTLAGAAVLFGKGWDALSDPLVGWLSDRTRSPFGRRYPWMLGGMLPLAASCILQWVVPPTNSQWLLFAYYSGISLIAFTSLTTVLLPFSALAAELTRSYNERINLISFKSAFSIGGSIFALITAKALFALIQHPSYRYLAMGSINGFLVVLAVLGCVVGTWVRYQQVQRDHPVDYQLQAEVPLLRQALGALENPAFRWVIGLYLCSWTAVQVAAVVLPYFVVDWMGLSETQFVQMALVVQGTAVATIVLWNWLGRRTDKRTIYFLGAPVILAAQFGLFCLQPGQSHLMFGLAAFAGVGTATVYLVPWSMLPDVVDFDEARTGLRREGIFYGFAVFIQKIGIAIAIFLTSRVLEWSGYISSTGGDANRIIQSDTALWTIRLIIGPIPAVLILIGIICAWFYPITRSMHRQIVKQCDHPERDAL
ncbi:MAG: MFS transporter [Leptolyngbyaceae cyanobacterium]